MNFSTIKKNFDRKLWGKAQVKVAVRKGIITATEYERITREKYE